MMYRFLYFFILLIPIIAQAQVNHALIVVIDEYPRRSGWEDIHAANDTLIIVPMLRKQGYKRENIRILSNSNATKKSIVQSFGDMYDKSRPGDYLYIHFSCHGQQMTDDNGDEDDGLDEALIPYDAKRRYNKGEYEGENHLRDDELGEHLERLMAKIGTAGNITVVLDACHSGTGTRAEDDDDYIRGTSYIFGQEGMPTVGKGADGKLNFSHKSGKSLSPITVFSACLDKEANHEYKEAVSGQYYGSLSYALCKVLSSDLRHMPASSLYKFLKNEMKEMFAKKKWRQTPYYETTNTKTTFVLGKQQ